LSVILELICLIKKEVRVDISMHRLKEKNLEELCGGCGKKHPSTFESKWDWHSPCMHYKTIICDACGYEIIFKTNDSSGRLNN